MSASVQRKLQQAQRSLGTGDAPAAAALCREVLERAPRNPDALWLLATAHLMQDEAHAALPLLERAVESTPAHGAALESLGLAHLMLAQYAQAERVLRKALALPGAPASVRMRLGLALLHQDRNEEAIDALASVVAARPGDAEARLNLGRAKAAAGLWSEAKAEFERVIASDGERVDALFNLGVANAATGQFRQARRCFERILERDPANTDARERLAALHFSAGRYGEALAQWREVARMRPADATVQVAIANTCFQTGALDEGLEAAHNATRLDSSLSGGYFAAAQIHHVRREFDRAVAILEDADRLAPSGAVLGLLVNLLHRMCEWEKWGTAWRRLEKALESGEDLGSPFALLTEDTTAGQQLAYTRRWAAARFQHIQASSARPARRVRGTGDRLRIGYFSSDFHEHPVAHLLVEALELHDRSRFEIHAYSYGPDDGSDLRARLRLGLEHFVDVARDTDESIVERMRADELDLLVDLRGYTAGDRLEVMAQRPAPVQATWLGYPATTGVDFIDYVIADGFVIPRGSEEFYSERVLRMPICYQPNDRRRPAGPPLTRAEYGLPDDAFVFCCFNQAVKITPRVFSAWTNLLRRVPGSVLWILEDNPWASENMRQSAAVEGLDPARVVSAPRVANPEHLARLQTADLALDTFPYTSHTTANDALWMGCPLVALCGDTFAARVSASILSSCGLPDLVTNALDDYEALAFRLATDAAYMSDVRSRLADARENGPYFDANRFARDLEALYVEIAE